MKTKLIQVKYGPTQDSVLSGQCTDIREFDTVKEAKAYARKVLTPEFATLIESTDLQGYSQVCVDGQCTADYFSKEEGARLAAQHEEDENAIERALIGNGDIVDD